MADLEAIAREAARLEARLNALLMQTTAGVAAHVAAADAHAQYQLRSEKDAVSGYAGLNAVSRVTKGIFTEDYIASDDDTKGVVLKSPDGHYWAVTVDNAGVLSTADLGTGPI